MDEEQDDEEEEEEEDTDEDDMETKTEYPPLASFPNNNALSKISWPTDVSKINFRSFMSTVSYLLFFVFFPG